MEFRAESFIAAAPFGQCPFGDVTFDVTFPHTTYIGCRLHVQYTTCTHHSDGDNEGAPDESNAKSITKEAVCPISSATDHVK